MNWRAVAFEGLFYIVFMFSFLRAIKIKAETDETFSKNAAWTLKGIGCLAIFGHHYGQMSGEPVLCLFTHFGYLMLNIFFLISGYGVSYGLRNKKKYLEHFLIKRCGKIILCYWLMNAITLIIEYCLYGKNNIGSFQRGVNIFFLKDASYTQASWYIMMLFWLYLSFYLAAHLGEKYLQLIMFLTVTGIVVYNIKRGMPLWYYNYLYSFNIGIYMAYRTRPERTKINIFRVLCIFVAFVLLFVISKMDRVLMVPESMQLPLNIVAVLSSTAFAVAVMFLMDEIKIESNLLRLIGGISTSIYIVHTCVVLRPEIQSYIMGYVNNWGACLWISLGITIIMCAGSKWLSNRIRYFLGIILGKIQRKTDKC